MRGFVINKFRGDVNLLRPGLRQLEDLTGTPVLGVVPWLDVDIEEEDSLRERFGKKREEQPVDSDAQYDILADALRSALDMKAVYSILGL